MNSFDKFLVLGEKHRWKCIIGVGILALILSIILGIRDFPVPYVHDEFAYLLGADTFAGGRLTNPTHEHWKHFETFHVIHKPTYQSKYPPASSILMAFGQRLFGHPIAGVWIGTALSVSLICWMLMAWLPGRWAFLGGIIAGLHQGIIVLWSQSYWGGQTALIGGALVLGAGKRLMDRAYGKDAFIAGIGFLILAHSRPFEGFLLALVFGIMILWKIRNVRVYIVLVFMGFISLASVAYYNRAVTGDYLKFPHTVWSETYGPETDNVRIAQYTGSPPGNSYFRAERLIWFYMGIWLSLPFLLIRWKNEKFIFRIIIYGGIVWVLLGLIVPGMDPYLVLPILLGLQVLLMLQNKVDYEIIGVLGIIFFIGGISVYFTRAWPHYIAMIAPLIIYLIVQSVRMVRVQKYLGNIALFLVLIMFLACIISIVRQPERLCPGWDRLEIYGTPPWSEIRSDIISSLEAREGKFLVFVRYPYWYNLHAEWVYNEADIDGAKIVWAHDLGKEKNNRLIEYYRDRTAIILDLSIEPVGILPIS